MEVEYPRKPSSDSLKPPDDDDDVLLIDVGPVSTSKPVSSDPAPKQAAPVKHELSTAMETSNGVEPAASSTSMETSDGVGIFGAAQRIGAEVSVGVLVWTLHRSEW